jgi:hypothetical protein
MADTKQQAGIDQIRIFSGVVQFDQFHPSTRIPIPNADHGLVNDVVISLHGTTNPYITVAGMPFRCPQAVRVSLFATLEAKPVSLDMTDSLLSEIRLALDSQDQKVLANGYQQAALVWLAYAEANLNMAYGADTISRDRQLTAMLASTQPLSSLMTQLGDRSAGFGGGMHLFNFLYSAVPLPGISLKKILDRSNIPLLQLTNLAIEFAQPVPTAGVSDLSGAVAYQAEVIVHNPIPDQLADLGKTLLTAMQEFDKKLQSGGALMQALLNAQDQILALKTVMESLEARFASAQSEIQQLRASTANLNTKIDGLH